MKKTIEKPIIVEGKYDKIKLSSIFNANIIETNGFSIFKNKTKLKLIKKLAKKDGVIIATDSDEAGFQIRNFLVSYLKDENVINVYMPDVYGKEKRKSEASREGKIGVEGINKKTIIKVFKDAGVFNDNNVIRKEIEKKHLYVDGFYGKSDSSNLRRDFQTSLDLPKRLSTNNLLDVLNSLYTLEEYNMLVNAFLSNENKSKND